MNKGFSWVFLLASGAFFVFIVGLTGYRIEDARKHNAANAHEHATSLAARVRSLRDITGSVQSPLFKTDMRDVFDAEPRLLLLALHSPQDGMVYLVSRNRTTVKEPAQITPDWRGTPVYQVNRGSEILVSQGLGSDMPGMTMDAVFVMMGREDLYPVVRDDLYLFLAFLLVCGVAILIAMSVDADAGPRMAGANAGPGSGPGQAEPVRTAAPPAGEPPRQEHGAAAFQPEAIVRPWEEPPRAQAGEGARGLTSPRTGLAWAEFLQPRLKAELDRAASADQDLSLAHMRIDGMQKDGRLPTVYVEIAKLLKQSFPIRDLIFETGDDSCAVILPDTDVDSALKVLDELRKKLATQPIEGRARTLSVGVSSRGGRLVDDRFLREEADVALAKASREGGDQVIGFRADAARFRETLTGTTA
jgi:diguanylate cyclase (GGDEF)-like protein